MFVILQYLGIVLQTTVSKTKEMSHSFIFDGIVEPIHRRYFTFTCRSCVESSIFETTI